jgi:hypothetical protein
MSMPPGTPYLQPANAVTVIRGASKTFMLSVVEPNGKPKDLSGATIYFTVKEKLADLDPIIQKKSTDSNQILILNAKAGIAHIHLHPGDTAHLEPKEYVFDVWVVLFDGVRCPVIPPSVFEVAAAVTVLPPGRVS